MVLHKGKYSFRDTKLASLAIRKYISSALVLSLLASLEA